MKFFRQKCEEDETAIRELPEKCNFVCKFYKNRPNEMNN